MGLFNFLKRSVKNKAMFTGLDNSGKSTIISFLQEGRFVEHVPTMGKDLTEMEVQGAKITFFDMGGQSHFRQMWLGEMDNTKCVVFVIDMSDSKRLPEAKEELKKLLPIIIKKKVKLLIFANKHDIKLPDINLGTIIQDFDLDKIDNFEIVEISAKTGYGMTDAFVKFYSILTGQVIKKSVVASAISIYNEGGIPLTIQASNDEEFNAKVLEGGFLAAITAFAKTKIFNSSVKFESEDDGTYIILRSENLIGALLWKKDLNIPINVSEEALKELMAHLETLQVYKSIDTITPIVQQYCTNLM